MRQRFSPSGAFVPDEELPGLQSVLEVSNDAGDLPIINLPEPVIDTSPVTLGFFNEYLTGPSMFYTVNPAAPGAAVRQTLAPAQAPVAELPIIGNAVRPTESGRYLVSINGLINSVGGTAVVQAVALLNSAQRFYAQYALQDLERMMLSGMAIVDIDVATNDEFYVLGTSDPAPVNLSQVYMQVTQLKKA